jgi:transcriptional regulator with XRE-family HTH domain
MSTHDHPIAKHEGRNVKRLREILGIKQETLAAELGINQQKMSSIEQKEHIEDDQMAEIARILKVPVDVIRDFNEEAVYNKILTFNDNSTMNDNSAFNYNCTINPIDRWVESLKKNEELYERLLQSEREKVQLLEKLLQERH